MREELLRRLPFSWRPLSEDEMVALTFGRERVYTEDDKIMRALAEVIHCRRQVTDLQMRDTTLLERARTTETRATDAEKALATEREEVARLSQRVDPLVAECADREAKRAAWQHRAETAEAAHYQYRTAIAGAAKRAGIDVPGPLPVDDGTAMSLLDAFVENAQKAKRLLGSAEEAASAAEAHLVTIVTAVAAAGKRAGIYHGQVPMRIEDVVGLVEQMAAWISPGRVAYKAATVRDALARIKKQTPIGAGRSPEAVMAEVMPVIREELTIAWQMAATQEMLTDREREHVTALRERLDAAGADVPASVWADLHAAVEKAVGPDERDMPRETLVARATAALTGASAALLRCMETASDEAAGARPKVGVSVVVRRPDGSILLGRRKGAHGAGQFHTPGGHLEADETYQECAARELAEETGIRVRAKHFKVLEIAPVLDAFPREWGTYVTVWLVVDLPAGVEAQLKEPDKCSGWVWHGRQQNWPGELFRPLESLRTQVALTRDRGEFSEWLDRVAGPHGRGW